jgi:hypothetical protein
VIEIGSSEAPVILNVSPHSTPWALWATKVGLIKRKDEPDEVMRAGTRLEPVVIAMLLDELGVSQQSTLQSPETTERHPERKWQRDTSDVLIFGDLGSPTSVGEVKCVAGQPAPVPRVEWVVQALHHLLVWESAEKCHLAAFGALRFVRWEIPRHQGALDRVLKAEEAFLDLVEKETPPPVVAADCDSLWRGWPLVADRTVTLPIEANAWDLMAVEAAREMEDAKERYDWARAQIKAAMGDAIRAVLPDGSARYSWAPDKRGVRGLRRRGKDGE